MTSAEETVLDLLIVGAGPAGLAASCAAKDAALSHVVVEQRGLVQSLVEHPQQIRYFSPSDELAIGGVPFFVAGGHKPTREDALAYYRAVATTRQLPLATWEEVLTITAGRSDTPAATNMPSHFVVQSEKRLAGDGERVERLARFVIVCTGTFLNPLTLPVPGATLGKVFTHLADPTPFFGRKVLVVGGGNSAATAAMTLAEAGAEVTVAMRRRPVEFQNHLRPFIVRDLTIMADEKRLTLLTEVRVSDITTTTVDLIREPYGDDASGGQPEVSTLQNDFVFALIGQTADRGFFGRIGIEVDGDHRPIYNHESGETAVPHLYLAGALSRANIILESRQRAVEIVDRIAKIRTSGTGS